MLSVAKQNNILFNDEYLKYQPLITNVQQRLTNDVELLGFDSESKKDTVDYINDKVSIFRFLKEADFDENRAIARLLDTIQWRKDQQISRMTVTSVAPEFFENGFAFFHKQDLLGRPVAVVQMRYFPKFRAKNIPLSEQIEPFACLVLEIARQLTRDLTRKNEEEQVANKPTLISQISIIIDVAKAPFVPIDSNLMVALKNIANTRFPGFIGSVYILNFGWMFQGIWQVVKLVLSEQAKARVNFVSQNEIRQVMDERDLLQVLGGKDNYIWSLLSDPILDLYATEKRFRKISPVPSSTASRRSSISSISSEDSIDSSTYFDAPEYVSRSSASVQFNVIRSAFTSACSSVYATPGTLTPIESIFTNQRLQQQQQQQVVLHRQPLEPMYFLTGFHTGDTFLTSFFKVRSAVQGGQPVRLDCNELTNRLNQLLVSGEFQQGMDVREVTELDTDIDTFTNENDIYFLNDHEQQQQIHFPHMLPVEHPQSLYMISPLRYQFVRAEQKAIRLTRKLFRLSFAYNGAVYWIVLYLFMRGPVENNLKKTLEKLMSSASPQQIAYTTAGITATLTAALSASFSESLLQSMKKDRKRIWSA